MRQGIIKFFVRLGIGFIDILILGLALIYIYLGATPLDDISIFTVDALTILFWVIILYLAVVVMVSLFLTYMREDNTMARLVKGLVATLLVMTLFNFIIFPVMWILGYKLSADVQTVLIVAAIARLLCKVFLRRYFGAYLV